MTQTYTARLTGGTTQKSASGGNSSTRAMLAGGLVAGPLFVTVAAAQALTRDGFDLSRHPLSMLSMGDLGWIQIGNFVVTGLLMVAFALGVRRALAPSRGSTWASRLLVGYGMAMVAAGLFVADPWRGFPIGAAEPAQASWHSTAHNVAAGIAFDLAIVACLLLARRFSTEGHRAWAVYTATTAVVVLTLTWWPDLDGISIRMAIAVTLLLGWAAATAAKLRHQMSAG